jgi:Transketolase, C-terminal domain
MVGVSLEAAAKLAEEGINAEVLNLRTLRPMDVGAIVKSVEKTNRVVCVEEGWPQHGIGAEISALLMERRCFLSLGSFSRIWRVYRVSSSLWESLLDTLTSVVVSRISRILVVCLRSTRVCFSLILFADLVSILHWFRFCYSVLSSFLSVVNCVRVWCVCVCLVCVCVCVCVCMCVYVCVRVYVYMCVCVLLHCI